MAHRRRVRNGQEALQRRRQAALKRLIAHTHAIYGAGLTSKGERGHTSCLVQISNLEAAISAGRKRA
jgi:hypothetical protein